MGLFWPLLEAPLENIWCCGFRCSKSMLRWITLAHAHTHTYTWCSAILTLSGCWKGWDWFIRSFSDGSQPMDAEPGLRHHGWRGCWAASPRSPWSGGRGRTQPPALALVSPQLHGANVSPQLRGIKKRMAFHGTVAPCLDPEFALHPDLLELVYHALPME